MAKKALTQNICLWFLSIFTLSAHAAPPNLKVGIFLSMSGGTATFGQDTYNGMKLAIDELNKAGKIKIDAVLEDEKSEPTDAANAVKKLINVDKVNIVLGSVASSNTNAAAPIAQAAKVPLITPASTNVNVTKTGDYISRICFIDDFQGKALAKFAVDELPKLQPELAGEATAAIVTDSASDYSQGLAKSFKEEFTKRGGKVVVEVSYSAKDPDFASQLTKIRTKNPKVIFAPGYYTEIGNMMFQAKKLKVKGRFLGGDGWSSSKLTELARDGIDGHYYSAHFSHQNKDNKVQAFVKAYQAKYGTPPSDMAALGYDSVKFAVDAFGRAGNSTKGEALKNAINSTKNFSGVTGTISLDQDRNASKSLVIIRTDKNGGNYFNTVAP